jgi:hypothetical protein
VRHAYEYVSMHPDSVHCSHAGVFEFLFFFRFGGDFLEEIDVVGVVKLVPLGNRGRGAAAALGEGGDDLLAKIGVEDFADADHFGG